MRLGTAQAITNAISSRKESLRFAPANGPPPASVPHTAKHDRINAAVAVSRGPQRRALPSRGTMARMLNALRIIDCSISGLKAIEADRDRDKLNDRRLEKPIEIERPISVRDPQDNHRRNHQRAGDIAEPPCERDGREPRELGRSSKDQGADPESRTDQSTRPKTKECEFRDGARAIKRARATRPDGYEISANERLKRVPD